MLPLISNKISRRKPEMRSTLATGTITLPSFACKRSGVIPDKNVLLSSSTIIAGIICVQSCARAWHPANRTRKRSMRRIAALLYTTILLKHKTSERACHRNKATGINFYPANRIFFPAGESVEQSVYWRPHAAGSNFIARWKAGSLQEENLRCGASRHGRNHQCPAPGSLSNHYRALQKRFHL